MTTVCMSDRNCYFCGATSKFPQGNLTMGSIGLRDLDGRPTHILRSAVYLWIQRCPACGYCAPEISEGDQIDVPVLQGDAYRNQLDDPAFPETANAFLCHTLVMVARKFWADAAWASVFAAWICDDNNFPESAMLCRRKAIVYFIASREASIDFAESPVHEELYLIDLHRRCGEFDGALERCDAAINLKPDDHLLDLLYLEKDLIEKRDTSIHTVADVDEIG